MIVLDTTRAKHDQSFYHREGRYESIHYTEVDIKLTSTATYMSYFTVGHLVDGNVSNTRDTTSPHNLSRQRKLRKINKKSQKYDEYYTIPALTYSSSSDGLLTGERDRASGIAWYLPFLLTVVNTNCESRSFSLSSFGLSTKFSVFPSRIETSVWWLTNKVKLDWPSRYSRHFLMAYSTAAGWSSTMVGQLLPGPKVVFFIVLLVWFALAIYLAP